ncbi:MAG: extracellular solute-binding protein [Lachnospiraceae bacterium]|nr:extracellular solute-binding protein [Lachnospiraceae bacterium]
MKRRIIAAILALTMTALAGCGGSGASKQTQEPAKQETQDAESGGQEAESGGQEAESKEETGSETDIWAPYDDTVTISTVTSEYASAAYPEGDDITNNVWIRAYKEKFNIEVVTDWVSDEYDTKINLSIAEGDLPDVFHVNSAQLQQLIDADLILDLTDVFDTYASERVKGYMEADADSFESGKRDGRLYGLAQMHWGIIDQPDYIWIRKDWKEELNLPDPETMDDLVVIAKTFMEKYGGYGIAAEQTLDHLNLLAVAWGAHPDLWIKDDSGKIVYGSVQPEMKDAIAAWAQWYQEGILSPDFVTMDFAKMNEAVVSGNVGIQPFYQWWGYNPGVDTVSNLGKEALFEPYMIPSATGEKVEQSIFFANNSYTVVSKKCKNPEAAVKLINFYGYMVDDAMGEVDDETMSGFMDNDICHVVGAFRVLNPNSDYEQYEQVSRALETGDTGNLTTSGMWQKYRNSVDFIENGTPGATGDYMQQGHEKCAYGLAKKILDDEDYIKSALWGATPETLLNMGSTLDDILTEGFTKIIMGEETVDYFDTIVQNWMAAGGEAATNEMNEMYGG